jgi:DNA repair protein RadC
MSNPSTPLPDALFVRETGRRYRQATAEEILEAARRKMTDTFLRLGTISDPATTRQFLAHHYAGLQREVFSAIFLDAQHKIIAFEDLAHGTIDSASVYPREVVKRALAHNAAALVFSHNHPSGIPEPSSADRLLTDRLRHALGLIDVRVLDHFVVGSTAAVSFAERGWV